MAPHDAKEESNEAGKDVFTTTRDDSTQFPDSKPLRSSRIDRRSVLKLAGVATSAAVATGLTGTASADTTLNGIVFDSVVNAVDDLGMDPTGNQAIDTALDNALDSGTVIEFPPGEYLVGENHRIDGLDRVGLRGLGSSQRDVRLTPMKGDSVRILNTGDPAGSVLVENLSFDERSDDTTQATMSLRTTGGSVIKDVEWLGRTPDDNGGRNGFSLNAEVTTVDGVMVIEGLRAGLDEAAKQVTYPDGVECVRAGPAHKGEVVLRDPVIHNRNSNATRYTRPTGVLTIEGGEFVNNQNASVRFGAGTHPSKVSSATGTYIRVDSGPESEGTTDAIRLHGDNGEAGAIFRDVVIQWGKESGRGVIAFPDWGEHGRAEFYNCIVRNDGSNTLTVNAEASPVSDDAVVFENCSFTGSGRGFQATDRPGSVIRDSCMDMPNASINGFETQNLSTSGCRVPEDANDSDSSGSNTENTLTVRGTGTATNYSLSVSEELVELASSLEDYETIDGTTVDAWVTTSEHVDKFGYNGEVINFEILQGGPIEITRNGEPVTIAELNDAQLSVGISVTETDGLTATLAATDSSSSTSASVSYDWDIGGTAYTGQSISHSFESPGTYEVSLTAEDENGATTTASTEVTVTYPNELKIQGTGTATQYSVTVDGKFQPKAGTTESWDDVSDTGAVGWVTDPDDVDQFTYDGEISSFEFIEGNATVFVNDEEIDPATLGLPNKIVLDGRNASGDTNYSLSVSGELALDRGLVASESTVTVSGGSAEGVVTNDVHKYRFNGDLTSLETDGNATMEFEDTDG